MARFSLFVVCRTVATCHVSLLPTSVHTGAPLVMRACRLASSSTILLTDIKKPPDPFWAGGPSDFSGALSRGTSPANLDGDRADAAHWSGKPKASPRRAVCALHPNSRPVRVLPVDKSPGPQYGLRNAFDNVE